MRTIAIGDIHGCRAALEALAEYAEFSEGDTIVTLGDYVDRGPDSKGVIDFLLELRTRVKVVSLMGNHEILMLAARGSEQAFVNWEEDRVGGGDTLKSYGADKLSAVPEEHWQFIEGALPFYEMETHFFVHANAASHLPLEDQDEFMLFWERFRKVPPHRNGKVMVCGHTSQESGEPVNLGHAICIDTWACGGQWLTALDVGSGTCWQCNEEGDRRQNHISAHLAD